MLHLLIGLLIACIGTMVVLRFLHPVAHVVGLIDHPRAHKTHQESTPVIGGIAVFTGMALALAYTLPLSTNLRLYLLAAASIVFLGVLDDRYNLSVRSRFVGHIIVASIIIFGGELYFHNLGNLFTIGSVNLGSFGIAFTYLAVMAAINAYNMIDGLDGLLGTQAFITLSAIALLIYNSAHVEAYTVAIILLVALVPFLVANLKLFQSIEKVFMGDAGSMFIGLSIVWLLINTTQLQPTPMSTAQISTHSEVLIRPVTALWLVAIPIMDMVYVIWRRIVNRQNPVRADQRHIHHLFRLNGFSNQQTVGYMLFASLIAAIIGVIGELLILPEWLMLLGYLLAFFVFTRVVKQLKKLAGTERVRQSPSAKQES